MSATPSIRIVHRYDGSVLWEGPAATMKEAIHAALAARANLSGARLSGANLSGADLSGANLWRADLSRANLSRANLWRADLSGADLWRADLPGANLPGANLSGADLSWADLPGANLPGANLSGANLWRADLSRANLSGANLWRANLSGADLSRANGVTPERSTPLLMLLEQPGPIRAYKLVTEKGRSPIHHKQLIYEVGQCVTVDDANTNPSEQCGAGVNVATLDWCLSNWMPGFRVFVVEFMAADIAVIPTATDGKFRLHRCTVVAEKDIAALVAKPEPAAVA